MLVLNNGDRIRGGASVASVVDYTIHGLVGEDLNRFADGQLSDSTADLYVATATVVVTSFVLVNTDNTSRTINLYLQPFGGTSKHIVTKDLSLGVGHSLHYDGVNVNILGPSSGLDISTLIELTDTPSVYDADKYLRSTIDGTEWSTISGGAGTSIHSDLSNLDYVSSGHTGFASSNDLTTLSGVLQTNIDDKSDTSHIHDDRYYTEGEVDTISGSLQTDIDGKATTSHTHDDRYYTESEVDTISGSLNTKIDTKTSTLLELTDTPGVYDTNKYLKSTSDGTEWATVSGGTGISNHSELAELDYVSAGHTGFQPSGDYATDAELTSVSGALQINIDGKSDTDHLHDNRYYTESEVDTISGSLNTKISYKSDIGHVHDDRYYTEIELDNGQLDTRYYTESEIDTISGSLQDNIDGKSSTLLELSDTPNVYDNNKYLQSTMSGIEWSTISGGDGTSIHSELSNLAYADSGHTGFQPSGDYLTDSEFSTYSGTLQSQIDGKSDITHLHDDRYYTESEVDTISGSLNTKIDGKPDTLIELTDTPAAYDISKYLRSTANGTEWATVSVGPTQSLLDLIDTPTTYSGSAEEYLKTTESGIEFSKLFSPDNTIYVAKNGNDSTLDGNRDNPFLTIEAANNYFIANKPTYPARGVIRVSPGIYEESITDAFYRIYIVSDCGIADESIKTVIIRNTGTSEDYWPIRTTKRLNLVGMTVETTTTSGVFGELSQASFQFCNFRNGHFIEGNENIYMNFNFCSMSGDTFQLEGETTNTRFIALRSCDISGDALEVTSSGTGSKTLKLQRCLCSAPLNIKGNWSLLMQRTELYGDSSITFDTNGYVDFYNVIIVNGVHFISDTTESKKFINCYFRDTTQITDITADVDVVDVEYSGNYQDKGLSGEIKITNPIKIVGYKIENSYLNITEALKSSFAGETVQIYSGTYNENISIPEGVDLVGFSNEHTIVTSSSGTLLTKTSDTTSIVKNISFISTASGINDVHIFTSTAGTTEFIDCVLKVDLVDMYTESVVVTDSNIVLNNTDLIYTQTGTTTGSGVLHKSASFDGNSSFLWKFGSFTDMTINDGNDLASAALCYTTPTSNVKITMNNSKVSFLSQYPLWGGDVYGMKINGTVSEAVSCSELIVTAIGSGGVGTGYIFYFDTSNNDGTLYGTLNTLTATGFAKNYVGFVGEGDEFNSHFDLLNASDSIGGLGTINYVNSPGAGNLMISGAYVNMYDNDLIVAKRGGEFTSIKAAMESITDNSSTNRYNIHVHSGFYEEDNPITLKPYVYINGAFKHNPRIIPANPLEHLFVVPTGYCTCDFGEITLQAPVGDSSHQVYIVYAGSGCSPITGLYNCLFLGTGFGNGGYCNGFYCEEPLAGYHTVNCMLYGEFNKFANMNGGCWTDSGTLPEFTTALNHYLYMTGEGTALIDLMRNTGNSFANLLYINHADAKVVLSDVYSLDQKTLITGPLGGDIQLRGSSLNGKIELDAGDVTIHSGSFENNSYLEALTGNLSSLMITSTRNKNENTHCINVTGGGNTKIYMGGGNIFDSPNGIDSIKLDGTFADVQIEGVRQYNLPCLASGVEHTFEHLPDLNYSRMVQIQAYPGVGGTGSVEYLTADESKYIQEDEAKTVFTDDIVTLSGAGSVAYGHWHLNKDGADNVAVDSSGNGRDGTLYSMESDDWISPGKLGAYCIRFNDSNEHIRCGNVASFNYDDVFSLDFWYNTVDTNIQYAVSKMSYMLAIYPGTNYYRGYGAYLSDHRMNFILASKDTDNLIHVYTTDQSTSGDWHHCIITYDGSSNASGVHIWIDGQNKTLTGVADSLTNTATCNANFQISGRNRTTDVWVGSLDEVVVYEQELTSTEVAHRYNSGTGTEDLIGTYPTTEGYYITTASGSNIDMSTWTNIGGMMFDETIKSNTQIKYLLSVDGMDNWNYWDGTSWLSGTLSGIDSCGNSSTILESLNDLDFDGLFSTSSGTLDVAAGLKTTSAHLAPTLNEVCVNYSTPGSRDRLGDSSMKITYVDATHTRITNMTDKPITGIKCNILKIQPY